MALKTIAETTGHSRGHIEKMRRNLWQWGWNHRARVYPNGAAAIGMFQSKAFVVSCLNVINWRQIFSSSLPSEVMRVTLSSAI